MHFSLIMHWIGKSFIILALHWIDSYGGENVILFIFNFLGLLEQGRIFVPPNRTTYQLTIKQSIMIITLFSSTIVLCGTDNIPQK